MDRASLFKRRDFAIVASQLLVAPAFWAFSPNPTFLYLAEIALFGLLFVVAIYAFNRFTELEGKKASPLSIILLAASLILFVPALRWLPSTTAQIAAAVLMLIGLAYSLRLRVRGQPFQIKNLYLVKPVLVSLGYSLQWIVFTGSTSLVVLLLFTWHFFDTFVTTSLLDALDHKQDEARGVRTFVVVHGFERTLSILAIVNIVALLAGVAVLLVSRSPALVLLLFPRGMLMQLRLKALRAGKMFRMRTFMQPIPLRLLGLAGVVWHMLSHVD